MPIVPGLPHDIAIGSLSGAVGATACLLLTLFETKYAPTAAPTTKNNAKTPMRILGTLLFGFCSGH